MKRSLAKVLSLTLAIVVVGPSISCKRFSPNREDVKLKDVQQISSKLPVYPGFQDTGGGSSYSKSMVASIHKTYRSDARFDDVKMFYATQLTPAGWQLTKDSALKGDWWQDFGGRELRFEQGQYSVVIEYIGEKAVEPDWNYGVSIVWDDK